MIQPILLLQYYTQLININMEIWQFFGAIMHDAYWLNPT